MDYRHSSVMAFINSAARNLLLFNLFPQYCTKNLPTAGWLKPVALAIYVAWGLFLARKTTSHSFPAICFSVVNLCCIPFCCASSNASFRTSWHVSPKNIVSISRTCSFNSNQRRQSGLKSGESWTRVKKFRFSRKISDKFGFFQAIHKQKIDFSRQISEKI